MRAVKIWRALLFSVHVAATWPLFDVRGGME